MDGSFTKMAPYDADAGRPGPPAATVNGRLANRVLGSGRRADRSTQRQPAGVAGDVAGPRLRDRPRSGGADRARFGGDGRGWWVEAGCPARRRSRGDGREQSDLGCHQRRGRRAEPGRESRSDRRADPGRAVTAGNCRACPACLDRPGDHRSGQGPLGDLSTGHQGPCRTVSLRSPQSIERRNHSRAQLQPAETHCAERCNSAGEPGRLCPLGCVAAANGVPP